MAHEIDLKNYHIRTDMIVECFDKDKLNTGIDHEITDLGNDIVLEETTISKVGEQICNKKSGIYKTLSFKDITDKNNFKRVESELINVLKSFLEQEKIKKDATCLVIGLGNESSTPDSLGPDVINHVLVTRYLFELGEVEGGYRNVASFKPSVTGITGIETSELIRGVVNVVRPDFLIIIDALASSSIDRVNKTIQLTDAGILPGSGVGNNRREINRDTFSIPVISIGVPTIVDAVTIVSDTFKYMFKHFSYKLDNIDNKKLKFVLDKDQNYMDHNKELSDDDKEKILGIVGTLDEVDFKKLMMEVLSPIDYNLMVTPKEVDFIIKKLSLLIGNAINKSLHEEYNPTN